MPSMFSVEPPRANPENLLLIVGDAHKGKVVIPDFQRSFLWTRENIEELLVSLLQGYFIGTFLLLDTQPDGSLFPFRPIEGLREVNGIADPYNHQTVRLVLDGQQRITSLFYVLYEPAIRLRNTKNAYRFFFRVDLALDGDPSDAVVGISQADRRRMAEIEDLIQAYRAVPFSLFKDSSKFYHWLYSEQQFLEHADSLKMIEAFYQRFANFMVPVVALSPETGKDNIVNIFERINRTGISLSLFDLAAARLYLKGIKLRKLWKVFEDRDTAAARVTKPEFLLKMVALLEGKEPRKGTLLDVIDALSAKEFEARWETAIEFVAKAYQRITSPAGYGAFDPKWIPYTTLIVPLAALLHWLDKHKGGEESYRKVDSWYWANVFAQRYDQAVDTNTYRDVKEVTQWLAGGTTPEWMANLSVDRIDLNVDESRSAVYKGMMCLVVLAGAKDFLDGQDASLQACDDDHIFPKSRFARSKSINSILNRTLISKRTNKVKANKKPTEYLPLFRSEHGGDWNRLCQTFQSHLISSQALEAMERDDFDAFLEARRLAFLEEIRRRTGRL